MEKVCGIVAEYNPFHSGHAYHIAQTRALLGAETAIVCVMSGSFVQRGEPAVFRKHARAEAALRCGADLVIELPLPWALSSAEGFGKGAAALLAATGVVTHLSFGSESGNLAELRSAAELLLRPELDPLIREALGTGMSYARARQAAAETLHGGPLEHLAAPNNILGIEYLKAIRVLDSDIIPVTIPRAGAGHDAAGEGETEPYPSAASLRRRLAGGGTLAALVPPEALEVFDRETARGTGPVFPAALETALLSRLRALPDTAFEALPDAGEGLENRLRRAAREKPALDAILEAAKTRRYAVSRLRRMLWAAALGLRKEDAAGTPPYLRILGTNTAGRALLGRMRETAALPVLTKPAAVRNLNARTRRVFELESAATDFYVLGLPDSNARMGGTEWRTSPVMIK